MAKLNISQVAHVTGKSRRTIERALQSGKLSATKNDAGMYYIDVTELIRVYGALHNDGATLAYDNHATKDTAMSSDVVRQIKDLKEKLYQAEKRAEEAESRAEWAISQFEQEQAERRELSRRLLPAPPSEGGLISKIKRFLL